MADIFDDVWGSGEAKPGQAVAGDVFDDVWGGDETQPQDESSPQKPAIIPPTFAMGPAMVGGADKTQAAYDLGKRFLTNIPKEGLEYGWSAIKPLVSTGQAFLHGYGEGGVKGGVKAGTEHIKEGVGGVLSGVGTLAKGVGQQVTPGQQPEEAIVDEIWSDAKKKISDALEDPSIVMEHIVEHPVSTPANVLSAGMVLGAGLKVMGATSGIKSLGKYGDEILELTARLEPYNATKAIGARALTSTTDALGVKPSKLYERAVKFREIDPEIRADLINLALDKDIQPTVSGINKVKDEIELLMGQINTVIDEGSATGKWVPLYELRKGYEKLKDTQAKIAFDPTAAEVRAKLDGLWGSFTKEYEKKVLKKVGDKYVARDLPGKMTARELQNFKVELNRKTASYWADFLQGSISVEAQKLLANNARDSLEVLFPGIRELNKKEGALIELHREIERAAGRISNRDLVGLSAPVRTAVLGQAAGGPGMVAGGSLGILGLPRVSAKIATTLHRLKMKGVKIDPAWAGVRLGLYQIGKEKKETNK